MKYYVVISFRQGFHLNTQHLQSVGCDFCEALNGLNDTATNDDIQLTKDLNESVYRFTLYFRNSTYRSNQQMSNDFFQNAERKKEKPFTLTYTGQHIVL